MRKYKALFSSDWSECLSPNGPFDPLAYIYPDLLPELEKVFREYTSNQITLQVAVQCIRKSASNLLTMEQMDSYLDAEFKTYNGVIELIEWCRSNDVLFMLNTTGTQGYFQLAVSKGFLPKIPIIAANPFISYPGNAPREAYQFQVNEIADKGVNTRAAMDKFGFSAPHVIIMGDSGGDGPHFEWAAKHHIFKIASMAKYSLQSFCDTRSIEIDYFFGLKYAKGQSRDVMRELEFDFEDLTAMIQSRINLG